MHNIYNIIFALEKGDRVAESCPKYFRLLESFIDRCQVPIILINGRRFFYQQLKQKIPNALVPSKLVCASCGSVETIAAHNHFSKEVELK